jgi:DNA invertase Pin-like site-specific DNA recombinase
VARHLNDVRYDDRLANLEWGTQKQNAADAIRNGVMPQGEQRYNAKLTEDEVLAIRAAAEMGVSQKAIAAQYGIGQPSVSRIIRRKKWSHV